MLKLPFHLNKFSFIENFLSYNLCLMKARHVTKAQFTCVYYDTPLFEIDTIQDFPNARYVLFITEIFLSFDWPHGSI